MKEIQILNNGDTLNAIRTKINENFAIIDEKTNVNPLMKFTANSGNETDGVADLLTRSEDATYLTFKVGGDYPNLVYTNGNGETFEVSSLDPLYFENLQAGTYIILVNGTSTQITNANIHYQLVEPTEVNSGDIWFNGNGAYQALVLGEDVQWMNYPFTPIGEATFRTNKIAFSSTYPYNSNKLIEASSSSFGLLRTAAQPDELNCHCEEAVITPANLYSLNNYRTMNTEYQLDEKVGCPYHHNLQLTCIQAGTTSSETLNTRGPLEAGTTIEDGTVIWEIEELGTGSGGGTASSFNLGDMIITDHVLEGEEAIGKAMQGTYVSGVVYPDFYNKYLAEKNAATATETTLGDSTLTMYVHPNGHQFYNIADKTIVDTFYRIYGIADFYGIDEENERIFLPRDKYFAVKGSVSVAGDGKSLGLTDGSTNVGLVISGNVGGSWRGVAPATDAYGANVGVAVTAQSVDPTNVASGLVTDPTKSGVVGKLQPNENRYLYYCVGNTIINKANINAGKVLDEAVLKSSLEEIQTVVETYDNGTSGYRTWSDGYHEEWGQSDVATATTTIYLLKKFRDTNYSIYMTGSAGYSFITSRTVELFIADTSAAATVDWKVSGYIY